MLRLVLSITPKEPFIFYQDPPDPAEKLERQTQPQRSNVQTDEQYNEVLEAWKTAKSERVEKKLRGNSMAQKLYAEIILPKNIERIKELEVRFGRKILFQEDGDVTNYFLKSDSLIQKSLQRWADEIFPPQQTCNENNRSI